MSNMHTPGPWEVLFAGKEKTPLVRAGGDMTIDCGRSGMTHKESCANAMLIAAAPELLAALDILVNKHHSIDSRETEVVAARAAIAKATGSAL